MIEFYQNELRSVRYAEKKQHEEILNQAEAIANGEVEDWQEVLKQWNEYYNTNLEP